MRRQRLFKPRRAALAFAASLLPATVAAQQGAAPVPPTSGAVTEVTVTAAAPPSQTRIDRRSYSLSKDLAHAAGSLADALRNVPSVQVTADGGVSLRGDSSVTILVDGKPSALFSGLSRAEALQSLPADRFERVEVMTNPSAAVTAEGTGGVINLISRAPGRGGATTTGQVKGETGSDGRYAAGLTGAYDGGGFSVSGGLNVRQRVGLKDSVTDDAFPGVASGALAAATAAQAGPLRGLVVSGDGTVRYDLDARTSLDGTVNLLSDRTTIHKSGDYAGVDEAGAPALAYGDLGLFRGHFSSLSGSVGATRKGTDPGQALTIKLDLGQNHTVIQNGDLYAYRAPMQPDFYQDLTEGLDVSQADLKLDYTTPLPHKAKLSLGYEGSLDLQRFIDVGRDGSAANQAVVDPAFADTFHFDQQVHALYVALEQTRGRLTLQPGLRLEAASVDTELAAQRTQGRQTYLEAYPSLNLSYRLDADADLKAGYSRRIERPGSVQLDPFEHQTSPTTFWRGNPDLRPAISEAYEFGWEFRRNATVYQASLFYRDKQDAFTTATQDLGGGVLLATEANLGRERNLGLELAAARPLTRTLSIDLSADVYQSRVDGSGPDVLAARSMLVRSGRASLTWRPTARDEVQASAQAEGRTLTAQGYRTGMTFVDLGWRHRFGRRLAAVITVQDPFDSYRSRTVIETTTLDESRVEALHIRAVFAGFTYALGGAPKSAVQGFDFRAADAGQH